MKAECTWGDGPDVLVVLDGTPIVIYEDPDNQRVSQGSFDLTANEAEALGADLIAAAKRARYLDKQARDLDKLAAEHFDGDESGEKHPGIYYGPLRRRKNNREVL